jgi:hypothetical protein
MATSGGNTVYRFNGGAPPAINPTVPNGMLTKLGTVTFNSLAAMTLPGVLIGSTVAAPNVSISGTYDSGGGPVVTTFSLAAGNLLLPNSATTTPIGFGAPLPIKISDISAIAKEKNNAISWSTTSEYNNDVQIVEASADGVSGWRTVAKFKSKNIATGSFYVAYDNAPKLLTYYRVRSIDFDGAEYFSDVVSVLRETVKTSRLRGISPMPTQNIANVELDLGTSGNVNYRLVDAIGKEVLNVSMIGIEGLNVIPVDLSQLPAGTYTILIQGQDLIASEQIIKQ